MRHQFCALLACAAACALAASNAMAAAPHGVGRLGATADTAIIVKVHSRRRAHDMLHAFGFRRVIFRRQFYDDYDKPVYRFSACRSHRRFRIDVNWYGDIMSKRRV
ncbi:MAG: hypothetical protein OEM91_17650, partial [Hyphomicrobiales bacterium]|nr:hypothetical protein [Hyphomicrobiales bacterium]